MHSALENIAQLLGNPIAGRSGQKIEPLIPTEQAKANAKSLSVVHGLGSFPMHTDGRAPASAAPVRGAGVCFTRHVSGPHDLDPVS